MLNIGITGGIGAGKSVVCQIFRVLGIPVYDADLNARLLMESSNEIKTALINQFGKEAYNNGNLNRVFIAGKVFQNPVELERLNKLVHPVVMRHFADWRVQQDGHPYTLKEAAILFESGSHEGLDAVILVDAPENIRIQRVIKRDGRTEDEVKAIISRQWTSEEKRKIAEYIIENDDRNMVIPQVLKIDEILRKRSEREYTT